MCLKCFHGGCLVGDLQHSRLHFEQQNHPLVLNIRQVAKQQNEPIKVDKLAVGVQGGIDNEKELWETQLTLKCLACAVVLDHTNVIFVLTSACDPATDRLSDPGELLLHAECSRGLGTGAQELPLHRLSRPEHCKEDCGEVKGDMQLVRTK